MHAPSPRRSLAGASVILTRPAGSAGTLARRVRALGAVAVTLPGLALRACGETRETAAALRAARRGDLVVFTSPAAVRFAWRALPGLRFARRVRVAAVGGGTARALRRRGVAEVVVPSTTQDSRGLLAEAPLRVGGKAVAVVGAPGGRDLLVPALRSRGARVQRVDVYERTAPRWTRRHFAALDAAPLPWLLLLSSGEAMEYLVAALPPERLAALRRAECIVSSARLAGLAAGHGFERVHLARSALADDLLAAAAAALARHRL